VNPIALGIGGLVALFMLAGRKAEAAPLFPPDPEPGPPPPPPMPPEPSAACSDNVMLSDGLAELVIHTPIPGGWRRLKGGEATGELISFAQQTLGAHSRAPYGSLYVHPGAQYAAMIEQHCHGPGGPTRPWGRHHGVTLLAKA